MSEADHCEGTITARLNEALDASFASAHLRDSQTGPFLHPSPPKILERDTKRVRLRHALLSKQQNDRASNCVIAFATQSMAPVRYRDEPGLRTLRQDTARRVGQLHQLPTVPG